MPTWVATKLPFERGEINDLYCTKMDLFLFLSNTVLFIYFFYIFPDIADIADVSHEFWIIFSGHLLSVHFEFSQKFSLKESAKKCRLVGTYTIVYIK
jgi:hypothetical protein